MAEVGIRQLRDHLSKYLEQVQGGDELVVTDRGRAIARVLPMSGERTIERLIREGKVSPARTRKRSVPTPLTTKGTVSDLVAEQRRRSPTSTPPPSSRSSSTKPPPHAARSIGTPLIDW